jgi:hypothetical protein
LKEWKIGEITVSIELGPFDDSKIGLVVKSKTIPIGNGSHSGPSIIVKESSSAKFVEYWPNISMENPNRRSTVFEAAKQILKNAENHSVTDIGFLTMGLELARIPTWEIAEELTRALNAHSREASNVKRVYLIASSPTQHSSFQFALNNAQLYSASY